MDDLVLRTASFEKVKVIDRPVFESEYGLYGASTNDFRLVQSLDNELIPMGYVLTYGKTEFGGKILERVFDTKEKTVSYIGRTFRGQLDLVETWDEKLINPTANFAVHFILQESGLLPGTGIPGYDIESAPAGATTKPAIPLPVGSALKKLDFVCQSFGKTARFVITPPIVTEGDIIRIVLNDVANAKYDESQVTVIVDDNKLLPTALVATARCGSTQAASRPVVKYAYLQTEETEDGSSVVVGTTTAHPFMGMEQVQVFEDWPTIYTDQGGVSAATQFTAAIKERLLALRAAGDGSTAFAPVESAEIGDKVVVSIDRYGVKISQTVNKKTLKLENGVATMSIQTGGEK